MRTARRSRQFYASHGGDRLHRLILGLEKGDERIGDHKNGDTLDNRRSNLRITDMEGNARNKLSPNQLAGRFKGIYWSRASEKWVAQIRAGEKCEGGRRKRLNLGHFAEAEDAARAYDAAAWEHFGEFAKLNFPR